MPKQYIFNVWRAGKKATTVYNICQDDERALVWIITQAKLWEWGEHGLDWTVCINSCPLNEIYDNDGDKIGFLCELTEELFARELSNNCPNTSLRALNWTDLCDTAIAILEDLKK